MTDPRRLLNDRVAFARQVLKRDPFEHQQQALRSTAPYVVIAGGRRSGKSEVAQIAALHALYTHDRCEWLVTSANEDNARQFVAEAAELAHSSELASDAVTDELSSRLTLRNGSTLLALAPTPGRLRGHGRRVLGVTWEEAGFNPPQTFRDGRYTLLDNLDNGAQGWLIGSPWRPAPDHFFYQSWRFGQDGDPDFYSATWRSNMNPRLSADWIERERARLNSIEAAAELDGLWQDESLQFFPASLLETCTADIVLPEPTELDQVRPAIGLDFGLVYDHSAAVILCRAPVHDLNPDEASRPRFLAIPHIWPQGTELWRVVGDVVAWNVPFRYIAPEVVGIGAGPSQQLARDLKAAQSNVHHTWVPISTTAPLKLTAYGLVRWLLERGQLILPRHPQLLRQLAGIRVEQQQHGARIDAEDPNVHDDVADALAFAMLPHSSRRGGVRCGVARMADVDRAVADVQVTPLDLPVVETGGGLRIYQRPPLQSVVGQEVSVPAGVTEARASTPSPRSLTAQELKDRDRRLKETRRRVERMVRR